MDAEQKDVVAKITWDIFGGDEDAIQKITSSLTATPMHYDKLGQLKNRPVAMKAYLTRMLTSGTASKTLAAGSSMRVCSSAISQSGDDACSDHEFVAIYQSDEDAGSDHEFVENDDVASMRAVYGEMVGTQIVLYEQPWVLIPEPVTQSTSITSSALIGAGLTTTRCAEAIALDLAVFATSSAQDATVVADSARSAIAATIKSVSPTVAQVKATLAKVIPHVQEPAQACKSLATPAWITHGGRVLTVGMLGYEVYANVRRYYKGYISGQKCFENIASMSIRTTAGIAGGFAGASLMSGAALPGIIFASLTAGILAGYFAEKGARDVFYNFFGDDRQRALKSAYLILAIPQNAPPNAIRTKYLKLAQMSHPDKGGNHARFLEVNAAYELIRASLLSD